MWNWKLYTGKESDVPASKLGLVHRVVLDLFDDDSSPALFHDLLEEGFEGCGTLRSNRKGIPEVKAARLRKGESHFSKDESFLFMKWRDKREVMMSTFHDDTSIEKRQCTRLTAGRVELIQKPAVVEYNQHMGGVDKGVINIHNIITGTLNQPAKYYFS